MKTWFLPCLFAAVVITSRAEDIPLNDGTVIKNVKITESDATRIRYETDAGRGSVATKDATYAFRDIHNLLTYDEAREKRAIAAAAVDAKWRKEHPAEAKARDDAAAAERDRQAKENAAAKERALEIAKQREEMRRLKGKVLQVTPDGLLVDCPMPRPAAVSGLGRLGGAFGQVQIDEEDKDRPDDEFGIFLLVAHPKQGSKADGDYIDVDAKQNGVFKYTDALGVERTVKRFTVLKSVK